jgi:hypothetical protein
MKRELFDIWQNPDRDLWSWHVAMVNYVAHFNTQEEAERFVETTKKAREQDAKSVTSK